MAQHVAGTYRGNKKLKSTDTRLPWTEDQIQEYVKCSQDPIYFIKNYVQIVNVDRGLIPFELWPFQEEMIETMVENRFVIAKMPRQVGKCLTKDTYIDIRNKKTGIVERISIGEFHDRCGNKV